MKSIQRTREFCKQRGEHLEFVDAQDKTGTYGSLFESGHKASTDVIFRCQ